MNTTRAAVADCCSRQHVTLGSNQQVKVEKFFVSFFPYSRIPQSPHALPIATTLEFSREEKHVRKVFLKGLIERRLPEERRDRLDMTPMLVFKIQMKNCCFFQKSNLKHTHTHTDKRMNDWLSFLSSPSV